MMQEIKETLNQDLQKVKEDMRKELYQDVIRVLMEEFLSKRTPGESADTTKECIAQKEDETKFDPSMDENMMANIMKWS